MKLTTKAGTMLDARHLEAELGKEPPVLACLEPLLQAGLRGLAGGDLLVPGGERVGPSRGDVLEVDVEGVAGRHEVGEVDELDEALDPGLLRRLLGGVLADPALYTRSTPKKSQRREPDLGGRRPSTVQLPTRFKKAPPI
jgi:hypothetical protein